MIDPTDFSQPAPLDINEERLAVTEVINHPDYNDLNSQNDIAVLKVSGSFSCSPDKIYPACLPSSEVSPNIPPYIELRYRDAEIHLHWLAGHHCVWLGDSILWRITPRRSAVGQGPATVRRHL